MELVLSLVRIASGRSCAENALCLESARNVMANAILSREGRTAPVTKLESFPALTATVVGSGRSVLAEDRSGTQ